MRSNPTISALPLEAAQWRGVDPRSSTTLARGIERLKKFKKRKSEKKGSQKRRRRREVREEDEKVRRNEDRR